MCGILGILSMTLPAPGKIKRALDAIGHRGPDDEGYVFFGIRDGNGISASGSKSCRNVRERLPDVLDTDTSKYNLVLGSRRLAIIDLSAQGHQPMSYAAGSLWITYNGEIFNHRELRAELKGKGYTFSSGTDTEVVLAAYAEWGKGCLSRFNGQWAFCIYDRTEARLFCARDRFGIKPFYYWFDGRTLAFASEIKALLELPFVAQDPDRNGLADFVLFGIRDHGEESLFRGIRQLLPAHHMIFDLTRWNVESRRYYTLQGNDEMGSYEGAKAVSHAGNVRDLLIDAVKMRLISDVPVGSCLSGGLDSSSVVVIIGKLLREQGVDSNQIGLRQKTFTASYDDPSVDETAYAREVAHHTGVDSHFVCPDAERLWRDWDRFIYHHDGTCFSSDVYAGWEVMGLASEHVKVVLNGQGGDELFGGYKRYDLVCLAQLTREMRMKALLRTLSGHHDRYGWRHALSALVGAGYLVFFPDGLKEVLFRRRNRKVLAMMEEVLGEVAMRKENFERMAEGIRSLNRRLVMEMTRDYLPQLLHYDDRNGAAFSLENRVPFLDHRLVEYVNGIPAAYKMHEGWRKWLLRLAMKDLLPDKVLWRTDKIGFGTPSRDWMRHRNSSISLPVAADTTKTECDFLWRLHLAGRLLGQSLGSARTYP